MTTLQVELDGFEVISRPLGLSTEQVRLAIVAEIKAQGLNNTAFFNRMEEMRKEDPTIGYISYGGIGKLLSGKVKIEKIKTIYDFCKVLGFTLCMSRVNADTRIGRTTVIQAHEQ